MLQHLTHLHLQTPPHTPHHLQAASAAQPAIHLSPWATAVAFILVSLRPPLPQSILVLQPNGPFKCKLHHALLCFQLSHLMSHPPLRGSQPSGHMDIVGASGPLHSLDPMPGHLPSALVRVDPSFSSIVCSHSSYPHLSPHSPLLQSLHRETQHNALIAGTGAPQGRAPWGLSGSISLCLG